MFSFSHMKHHVAEFETTREIQDLSEFGVTFSIDQVRGLSRYPHDFWYHERNLTNWEMTFWMHFDP